MFLFSSPQIFIQISMRFEFANRKIYISLYVVLKIPEKNEKRVATKRKLFCLQSKIIIVLVKQRHIDLKGREGINNKV